MTNKEIVTKFLNGFNNPSQIKDSLSLLAEDYKFSNPLTKLYSKDEFIGLATEISSVLNGIDILQIANHDNWVGVFYEFKSTIPGLETNLASEWFRVEKGFIKESHLIYDASEWRKVYEQMNG